jgi:Kef-type K+ transport system membrane component KefB
MSDAAIAKPKSTATRVVQASALVVVFGLAMAATHLVPESRSVVGTVVGLGFLLLAGTLTAELAEIFGLPHLSGYLVAGLVAGPHLLHIIDAGTVARLSPVNTLTLALIALAGGTELRLDALRSTAKSLAWATLFQSVIVLLVGAASFVALARLTPFGKLPAAALFGVACLWGVIAVSRSPAALLGVFAQLRPKGPLADFSLAFVMLSDVVVVVLMAVTLVLARPLLEPGAGLSFEALGQLGHEILGSVALGVTLGLLLAVYLRLIGHNLLLVLIGVGVGLSELLQYIQFDALLSFLVAGFVVENFSAQGHKLLSAIERTGVVVFVIFFALAGAQLDVPVLKRLWPVALGLCATRGLATALAARLASAKAGDPPAIRRWGWTGLISQSGLTLGLSIVIVRTFPAVGEAFHALVIASCAINTVVGPILQKLALDRTGESESARATGATPHPAA